MNFKIDTTKNHAVIAPDYHTLDDKLTDALQMEIKKLQDEGHLNVIINLETVETSEPEARNQLLGLHEMIYALEGSLVFTGLNDSLLKAMKKDQLHINLNITPTMIEAIDIINMEILERELFNEL